MASVQEPCMWTYADLGLGFRVLNFYQLPSTNGPVDEYGYETSENCSSNTRNSEFQILNLQRGRKKGSPKPKA